MSKNVRTLVGWLAAIFGAGALYCALEVLGPHHGYRVALDHAGDDGLAQIAGVASEEVLKGFRDFLALDNWLVLLIVGALVCAAGYARLRAPASRLPATIVVAALLYALSDWGENSLVADGSSWAAAATWAKWIFFSACMVLVPLALLRSLGRPSSWSRVLFLDMPAMLDDVWRKLEFRFHRERDYDVEHATLAARPWYEKTPFWLFALTSLFVAYGPTLDGLCSIAPTAVRLLVWLPVAGLLFWGTWIFWTRMRPAIRDRVDKRFKWLAGTAQSGEFLDERAVISRRLLLAAGILLVAPAIAGAMTLGAAVSGRTGWCSEVGFSGYSVARLVLWALAVAAFARLCKGDMAVRDLLRAQAALVVGLALAVFVLAPGQANEASGHPYAHLFLVVAPIVCVLLCAAPWVAARRLRTLRNGRFAALLPRTELFVPAPEDAQPTLARVMHALTHGISDRLLQLLIPPALLALVAPADWLPTFTVGGFVLAVLLSTWGNMSSRWQHMAHDVQRWLLRGTASFVSVFVIALGVARVFGIDYVATILDAAPLGVVFGIVVMSYALSWLVEYWLNRAVAAELIGLLGATDGATTVAFSYKVSRASPPSPEVKVEHAGRHLMLHGIGRFAIVGRVPADHIAERREAFHSYGMVEILRVLAGERDGDAADASRGTDLYFHSFNAALVLLALAFWLAYWHGPRYTAPTAMVEARTEVPVDQGFNLAEHLLARPDDTRPALVVAASGGGTRAALYTAHVLEGLHGLGASRDIVLMSGVSGGGVALAYFATNREALTAKGASDKQWRKFRKRIADAFIQDVLGGATELRMFGADSLSLLLAESFGRRLAKGNEAGWTLGVQGAGLILNTTITGHPDTESDLLAKTLDPAGGDCDRSFSLMAGGRLIFTNLTEIRFPERDNRMPDVRLPYVVVRDPAVKLQHAAALNANFPPVFPNARVLLHDAAAPCGGRSFFVTDGGALENLGLVSALYALRSALEEIRAHCGDGAPKTHAWCRRTLRPIRFIIAEASAATFDYEQDRGISAVLSAKERLTGGLTEALIAQSEALYRDAGVPAGAKELDFHFLGLPLAFRARGGLGTHWMHAGKVEMIDPRLREVPARYELWDRARATVTISRKQLGQIWRALHEPAPDRDYCGNRRDYTWGDRNTDRVRHWVCGGSDGARDLHIESWRKLRQVLGNPKDRM